MIITICIANENYEIEVNKNDKITEIKTQIIEKYFSDKDKDFWVEFIYRGNRTIREFGKHNLIKDNQIPSTMDNITLLDYSDKEPQFIFEICECSKKPIVSNKSNNNNNTTDKYIPSFKRDYIKETPKDFVVGDYDVEFPPL
jgi:hypothetical protein